MDNNNETNFNLGDKINVDLIYEDLSLTLKKSEQKLQEINRNISNLNYKAAHTIIKASTFVDPSLYIGIHEITLEGTKIDNLIAAGQQLKNDLLQEKEEDDIRTKSFNMLRAHIENLIGDTTSDNKL